MKARLIFALILLVLVSFAHAAVESDFVKVTDIATSKEYYTQKTMEKSDLVIGVDKLFYGSSNGEVLVKMFVKGKAAIVSKIGIEGTKATISVKDFGGVTKDITPVGLKNIEIAKEIIVSEDLQEFTFTLTFNPAEVGLQDEFDIVLYDAFGIEIARLDPFLSGFTKRIPFIIHTTLLPSSVTNDHTILVRIKPSDTNVWNNHTYADCNGIDFTKTDGTTQLSWDCEDLNNTTDNAYFWVKITDTFSSTLDSNGYLYVGGANTDYSDGTAAYPADYNAFYQMNQKTGLVMEDATGHTNGLVSAAAGWTSTEYVDGAYNFAGSRDANANVGAPTNVDYTITLIANPTSAAADDVAEFDDVRLYRRTTGACAGAWYYSDQDGSAPLCGKVVQINTWQGIAIRYSESDTNRTISSNGIDENSAIYNLGITRNTLTLGKYWDGTSYFNGYIDNVRYFNRALSSAEVKLIYLSDSNQLVTFGAYETGGGGLAADFNYNVLGYLDPENGINSVNADFNNTSTIGSSPIASYSWLSNSVVFSTDQNVTKAYTTAADYNVCLTITAADANVNQRCYTVTIPQAVQAIGISYDLNSFSNSDVNVLFKGTATGTVTDWNWLYDGVVFGALQNSNKVFTSGDSDANICVIATASTASKIYCKTYYVSEIMVKKPIKESDGVTTITPFGLLVNSVPTQSYSALVADTNFFNFSPTIMNYNLTVDANDSLYFDRIYAFSTSTANYTLQPYLADASTGTSIKIVTLSSVDYSTIGGVSVLIYKNLPAGRILVESVVTDDKGEAFTSGIINNAYEYEVYYNGLFIDTFDITVTSTTIYISFNPSISSSLPSGVSATIGFTPNSSALIDFNNSTTFKQTFTYEGMTAASIRVWAKQIDVNGIVPDANLYSTFITVGITSGYTNTITYATQLTGWDENQSLMVYAQICFTDGNCYLRQQKYYAPYSASGDTWNLLTRGVWTTLGCSGEVCPFLALLALLISICVVSWLAVTNPLPEVGNHLGIVFIIVLGIFVVINWLHWALWLAAALATFFISTVSREAVK